ncbi:MAG: HAD hydrolase family protein [Pseudomonadota bacterium]
MQAPPELLVVSDLDGTLLDHHTYSWTAAAPALDMLRRGRHALILASSKTAAEVDIIRSDIGFAEWPAVVENGCGVLDPGAGAEDTGHEYQGVRDLLADLPQGFRGFGDMSAGEVADLTGLSVQAARRAKQRRFSEPGLWLGEGAELRRFIAGAEDAGLVVQRGGRFITVSRGGTKADRVAELVRRFSPGHTIVLGDAPNDIDMLQLGDHGVIVANPDGPEIAMQPGEDTGRIRRTTRPGPDGWADAITDILNELAQMRGEGNHG